MSDDILTRLRKCTCLHLELLTQTNWFPDGCIQCAAADEIERLRADRDRWQRAAESLITQCGCDSHCPRFLEHPNGECECGFNEPFQLYQKAVRGG